MLRRSGPGGTLPRVRPAPEPNVVQAPEISRQLQQRMGIRGAHFAPTLEPTIQPVVVVETLRETSPILQVPYAAWARCLPDVTPSIISLFNVAGSQRRLRVQAVYLEPVETDLITDVLNIGAGFGSGASSPQAIKIGIPMHVSQFNSDLPVGDARSSLQVQAAGRLLPYTSSPLGIATFFEQRIFVSNPAPGVINPPRAFLWQPHECWIYPNSAISFWFDSGAGLTIDLSAQWYEEKLL